MNCTRIQQLLTAYSDAELTAGLNMQVAAHLSDCAACQSEFSQARQLAVYLREADDYLGDAPGLAVPAGFADRVLQQARLISQPVARLAPVRQFSWSLRTWLAAFSLPVRAAIVAAVLLALVGGLQSGRVVSELAARASLQEQRRAEAMLGMTPAERAMMQLLLGAQVEGINPSHQPATVIGERQ